VPLRDLVHKFAHVRFEPSGFTSNPEIPIAKSIVDYIFRWMGSRFLPAEERASLGLVDRSGSAESSIKPLTLGLGGSLSGSGGAGISGSGALDAAAPASPPSGTTAVAAPGFTSASEAGAKVNAAGVDSTPAGEWPTEPRAEGALPTNGNGNGNGHTNGNGKANGAAARVTLSSLGLGSNIGKAQVTFAAQADAPSCAECGSIMVRNGSCYKCLNCGSTSGCS
jgi:ribonucleoside-diphosphate reductase alpha chain